MRSDRYTDTEEDIYSVETVDEQAADTANIDEETEEEDEPKKKRWGRKSRKDKQDEDQNEELDLTKLKKKELLEIMLAQGREIDSLRAQVAELQAQLDAREVDMNRIGSLAEASLALTNIFKEADEAAKVYLMNIRRKYE